MSAEFQEEVARLNQTQEQLEYVSRTKASMDAQIKEIDFAIKELEKLTDDVKSYRMFGGIMVETKVSDSLKDLTEQKETLEIRMKSLEKQEERLKTSFEERRKVLQEKYAKMSQQAED